MNGKKNAVSIVTWGKKAKDKFHPIDLFINEI